MTGAADGRPAERYTAQVPRHRTATAVLLLHLLLGWIVLRDRPPSVLPPSGSGPDEVRLRLIEPAEMPAPAARTRGRRAEAQALDPEGPLRTALPEPSAPAERVAERATPEPAAGSPAPLPSPLPMPQSTPARGESAVAGSGGTAAGSGTGQARTTGSGFGSGAGAGGGGGRAGGRRSGGGTETITLAQWETTEFQGFRTYYPVDARRLRLRGEVTLICHVRLDRSVRQCRVERERPSGYGFGQATVRASREFRVLPPRVNGAEVDNALVRIPIGWRPD